MDTRLTLLGPVGISVSGAGPAELPPRHRGVLAYLLLHEGVVVGVQRLIAAMWGASPPSTAKAQIQASIAAIRKVLRKAGLDDALATRGTGYVLRVPPGLLDLDRFNAAWDTARRHTESGEDEAGVRELRAALALWQGRPLTGIPGEYVDEAADRLEERRIAAVERLAELELKLGRHEAIIDELRTEREAHPLREKLTSHLMLALYRSGRQTDALGYARTLRKMLADQQGLDPSSSFLALERAILRDEVAPVRSVRTRQTNYLPFDLPDFTGRFAEMDRLEQMGAAEGTIVTVCAIDGMAGAGKTSLAVHAAYRLAERFPDGQLFVDLQGYAAIASDPVATLSTLLLQLGVAAERLPASAPDLAALWRAELVNRRVIVVVDNAGDVAHVRHLLPGPTHSLIIVTSRRRLVDLDGAATISLDVMSGVDAATMFTDIVGERAIGEPLAVLEVVHLCGLLPLAVRIAAARLRHRPRWTVAYLADRLRDQRGRLGELETADRGVAAAFALSYQQLTAVQQRMFRLLALHPGADIDSAAAAALTGLTTAEAERLQEDLLDTNMLIQHVPGRYTFHDLQREHARALSAATETSEQRDTARRLLFDHYLQVTSSAVRLYFPDGFHFIPPPDVPTPDDLPFHDTAGAAAWLETEYANLIRVGTQAKDLGFARHTIDLAITLHRYLRERAFYADAHLVHSAALTASRAHGTRADEGRTLINLGEIYWYRGDYGQAERCYHEALDRSAETGDRRIEARALNNIGAIRWMMHDYAGALTIFDRVVPLHQELGLRIGEAAAMANLAIVHHRLGDNLRARALSAHALGLARSAGHRLLEANLLDNLGIIDTSLGSFAQARDHHLQALEIYRELGNLPGQAAEFSGLGEAALSMGDSRLALAEHGQALAIAKSIEARPAMARAYRGLCRAEFDLGNRASASAHGRQALALYTELRVPEAAELAAYLDGMPTQPS